MVNKVSIIVLNYNGLHFLKDCFPTIQRQTYQNIEVIVTDNHSTDGSIEYVKQFPDIKLVEQPENYGYAKANNIAAKQATGTFLFFLNNDTELFDDTIEKLVKCYEKKSIVGAHQIPTMQKDSVGSASGGMDIFGYPFLDQKDQTKTRPFYVDGATFFIKKTDFFEIGMFDEELFIFEEDIDLSWRAQMMGFKIIPCLTAHVYHYSGGTVAGGGSKNEKYTSSYFRRYLNEKNIIRNILKNYSFPLCLIIFAILFIFHLAEIITLSLFGKWKVVDCYLKAYWWNVTHLKNTLKFRAEVQKKRTVSDTELMKRMYWSYSKLVAFFKLGFPDFK